MLFKWKGANKKSHQKWDFIVNLVLWLVKQRVTWPFPGDFWRKTTTNHHEPPRNHHGKPLRTTMNHHEPPWTTTNHHEPPQSLIQNEIWYWILDSDWLNSGSHIFLRILEKKLPWTTTNHYEPPRTMTVNHDMNHDSEPWHLNHDMNHDSEPWHEPRHLNHDEPQRNRVFRWV